MKPWSRLALAVVVAGSFGCAALAQQERERSDATGIQQRDRSDAMGMQRVDTPSEAARVCRNAKHSLADCIRTAEKETGGKAIAAECRMKSPTAARGDKDSEAAYCITVLVGDNQFRDVTVSAQTNKVLFQEDARQRSGVVERDQQRWEADRQGRTRGEDDFRMARHWHKSTDLIGKNVRNNAGEDLGSLQDIVVDAHSGRILYGVLSFGGFLGMGDKYFAIPWASLELPADARHLVLNVDKDRLKNAEGFDKSQWPNFANEEWNTRTYRYYGQEPYWQQGSDNVTADRQGGTRASYRERWYNRPTAWQKVSDLQRKAVRSPTNEKLGDVTNLAIDTDAGRIMYAIVGRDDRLYAVPWTAINMSPDYDHLTMNVTTDRFTQARWFNRDAWPNLADPSWSTETYRYYEVEPYWGDGADGSRQRRTDGDVGDRPDRMRGDQDRESDRYPANKSHTDKK